MTCEIRLYRDGADSEALEIQDDGRVAYAYLLDEDGRIVGDVWLYNRIEAPLEAEWRIDPGLMPFANPQHLCDPGTSPYPDPVLSSSDVSATWEGGGDRVEVFVRGELFAVLAPGAKPGWSRLAVQDGPLAKVLPAP